MQFICGELGTGFLCSDFTHFLKIPIRVLGPILQLWLSAPPCVNPCCPLCWGNVNNCSVCAACLCTTQRMWCLHYILFWGGSLKDVFLSFAHVIGSDSWSSRWRYTSLYAVWHHTFTCTVCHVHGLIFTCQQGSVSHQMFSQSHFTAPFKSPEIASKKTPVFLAEIISCVIPGNSRQPW